MRRRAVLRCRQCSRAVLGAAATEGFIGFHAHPVSPEKKTAKPLRRKRSVRRGGAGRGGAACRVAASRRYARSHFIATHNQSACAHPHCHAVVAAAAAAAAEADLLTTAVGGGRRLACGCATRRVGATRATQVAGDKHAGRHAAGRTGGMDELAHRGTRHGHRAARRVRERQRCTRHTEAKARRLPSRAAAALKASAPASQAAHEPGTESVGGRAPSLKGSRRACAVRSKDSQKTASSIQSGGGCTTRQHAPRRTARSDGC